MGYVDINTTMDIYAEVTETKKREAMENLSKNMKIFQERVQEKGFTHFATKKQICNDFGFDSALWYYVVHPQKCHEQAEMCDNAGQCMKTETHSDKVATIVE